MAIQQQSFGGADVLRPAELPLPEVGRDEVLVEVTLAGVKFGDLHGRKTGDNHVLAATLPFVPGSEIVGRRVDTSQRVLGLCGLGGYPQCAAVPVERLFAVPDDIDDETALALFVAGTTAWHLLRTCARLAADESVAVHGAAGAVGSIAIQLAKSFGASRVVGSASGRHRRDFALGHGADAVVDSAPDGLYGQRRRANQDEPFDVVLDSTGGAALADSLAGLAPFGRLVPFATAAGPPPPIAPGRLIAVSRSIAGFWLMDCFARDGTEPVTLGNVDLPAGVDVFLSWKSANFDNRCSPTRRPSICNAPMPIDTSPSAAGPTSASALPWPAWRYVSPWTR